MDMDRIFMDGLKECREDLERRIEIVNKKIERVEQSFWRKLASPYLNYLKKERGDLKSSHFRFYFSEKLGKKGNPKLAAKVFRMFP